ncbi:uncharacterized protein FIBRA_06453 [Fibroporia radiculosa]|uniref:Lariat debranching enzyme C-terminal domain-containing protein n=1 Tax=Fibroporia radiculosa TaxID=599839 RepID=J4HZ47_9APHY|nr:uncharacterized protein FIBRA_06453 [Fibroporia radiculosa]CCM04282.1 predicted protein [Fibroporia radiculosa]
MAVPDKYRELGGFCKYYSGEKRAPILTIVIGGNHESSNYLWELYHGGWLAPNIYFLGHAGCVQVNGIRIAGASGIFKYQDFQLGHWERLPYNHGSMRSIYHIREFNVRRLSLLSSPTVFLSHDWPRSIEQYGNLRDLLRRKPYFREDIQKGSLGSPPLMGLMKTLQPDWWFSAHLHCRFEANVRHGAQPQDNRQAEPTTAEGTNPDEITIEDDDTEDTKAAEAEPPHLSQEKANTDVEAEGEASASLPPKNTKFIALDKCLPKRQFLEVIDVPESPMLSNLRPDERNHLPVLSFDPEWLAITRAFHPYMPLNRLQMSYPAETEARKAVEKELEWVRRHVLPESGIKKVDDCQTFITSAPPPGSEGASRKQQPPHYPNPQTAAFCSMLEIDNKIDPSSAGTQHTTLPHPPQA